MAREPLAAGEVGTRFRLTERKARFAGQLAQGRSPHDAGTRCGYSRESVRQGHVDKLSRDPAILRYISHLRGTVLKKAETSGILSLHGALRVLSQQAHANLGSMIRPDGSLDIKAIRTAKPGTLRKYKAPNARTGEGPTVEIVDPAAAARALVQFYSDESRGEDESFANRRALTVNVLVHGDPAAATLLDQLAQKLGAVDPAIPLTAKVVSSTDQGGVVAKQLHDPPVGE